VSLPARFRRGLGFGLAGGLAVVALTWAIEHVVPPPFSLLLALVLVGLAVTQLIKRQPAERAGRMFRLYFRARERGADERTARERLVGRLHRDTAVRERLARAIETRWTGPAEKDRAMAGIGYLLAHEGRSLSGDLLAAAHDRARDRFTIPGWEALPVEFVTAVRARLDPPQMEQLDRLAEDYRLFHQRFFRAPASLAVDPAGSVADFARLLASLGNRLRADHPGDAERAYRLSLRLRADENLAHAGLALVLEQTGRTREAAGEARAALGVLDALAAGAATRTPRTEDISPFATPKSLREALERVAAGR
jgi:hypothetical protein